MSVERAVRKYMDVIRSDVFTRYEKEFSRRINSALSRGYLQSLPEPPLVQIVENVVNGVRELTMKDHRIYFELSTKSVFIHGNKSQVEFDYYGQSMQRELADLIFIISVVFNGQKYFEKFTLNQFKKDKSTVKTVSWDISNREQLYLLSRFPTFKGVRGSIIPMREYTLPNYSGCLGSYGLLYNPGDFVFVSATELDPFMGYKNSLKINELYHLIYKTGNLAFLYFSYFYPDINELLYLMNKFYKYYGLKWYFLWNLFGNYHYASNVFDFAHKYLTVGIGEPIFMKIGIDNSQARVFLHELLSAVKIKARGEKDILSFIDGFFRYKYAGNESESGFRENIEFDFEGGGIGMIHTIINLGE